MYPDTRRIGYDSENTYIQTVFLLCSYHDIGGNICHSLFAGKPSARSGAKRDAGMPEIHKLVGV